MDEVIADDEIIETESTAEVVPPAAEISETVKESSFPAVLCLLYFLFLLLTTPKFRIEFLRLIESMEK